MNTLESLGKLYSKLLGVGNEITEARKLSLYKRLNLVF